jgi:hypothetical protein
MFAKARRNVRLGSRVPLALLIVGWIAQTPAQAGCGRVGRQRVVVNARAAHYSWITLDRAAASHSQPAPFQPSTPCDGPGCSSAPVSPLVPVTIEPPRIEQWGFIARSGTIDDEPSTLLEESTTLLRSPPLAWSLDRPPRPAHLEATA